MIPYFQIQTFHIGPVQIQVWGLMIALGIVLGLWLGNRQAVRRGLNSSDFLDMSAWSLLAAIVGSRLLYVFAYEPHMFTHDPLSVIRIWDGGMSALGGFIGAGIAFFLFCRRNRLSFLDYANAAAFALPWGYAVGRIGCFLLHGHPGIASNCFLAVNFADAPKLDMGLIHVLFGLAIGLTFVIMEKYGKNKETPYFLWFLLIYGLGRVGLDFFRCWEIPFAERRYFNLTPAQYIALPTVIISAWFLLNPPHKTILQRVFAFFRNFKRH